MDAAVRVYPPPAMTASGRPRVRTRCTTIWSRSATPYTSVITNHILCHKHCLITFVRFHPSNGRGVNYTVCRKNRTPETFYYNFAKIALI